MNYFVVINLFIFAGIIVRVPEAIYGSYQLLSTGEMRAYVFVVLLVVMVVVVAGVVIMTLGQRPIPVQYAKRVVGRKVYGGQATHIPLRVNTAGVIPVIFAASIIVLPPTVARFVSHPWMQSVAQTLSPGTSWRDHDPQFLRNRVGRYSQPEAIPGNRSVERQ